MVGILGALYAASGYIGAFIRASNVIYEVEEGRPFYKLRPLQVGVTVIMVVAVGLVISAMVLSGPLAESVGDALGISEAAVTAYGIASGRSWRSWGWASWASCTRLPNAQVTGMRWVTPGSLLALIVWIGASALFALYVSNFGSYNKTYGALGGAVTFLVWLWITNIAVLLGAELNAELERSREIEVGVPGAEEELQLPPRQ